MSAPLYDVSPWTAGTIVAVLLWVSWIIVLIVRAVESVALQKYAMRAKVAARARAGKSKKTLEDDVDDVPPWLDGLARAANIDLAKVADEDPAELVKVQNLIQARLQAAGVKTENNGGGMNFL